jgi:hypothetical protein
MLRKESRTVPVSILVGVLCHFRRLIRLKHRQRQARASKKKWSLEDEWVRFIASSQLQWIVVVVILTASGESMDHHLI